MSWLLVLASDEVDTALRSNRELLVQAFPIRARAMMGLLVRGELPIRGRGLALVDPASKRRDWLIASRLDGRRSPAPYTGYADAARHVGAEMQGPLLRSCQTRIMNI